MKSEFESLVQKYDLHRFQPEIEEFLLPCVGFDIISSATEIGRSRIGGKPILPSGFVWPKNNGRPLNHLIQIDLNEASRFDTTGSLPTEGLLTFFYDLEEQPWGFDPSDLQGFMVVLVSLGEGIEEWDPPVSEFSIDPRRLEFRNALSVPTVGSRSYDRLEERVKLTDEEFDRYYEFSLELNLIGSRYRREHWGGRHHLLGHSANVQGDMQLEAQLVTNGLYCGDASGYNDPRAKSLEQCADDWMLLLQVDSDETSDLMWGDVGTLYFWIKRDDLANRRFDSVWMGLQCS